MLCDNCGKREANVRYSENINGRVKQMNLCEECSKKLGIGDIDFNIPMDFSDFFGEFMEEFSRPEFMPLLSDIKKLKCNNISVNFIVFDNFQQSFYHFSLINLQILTF